MVKYYLVGGACRDAILGKKISDLDYAVEAPSYNVMRDWIITQGGEIFLETPEFYTIRCRLGKQVGDFVLCRKESDYSDGRHPDNVEVGTIYDDLCRRDFTMNAIALDMQTKEYLDPHNGINDIRLRVIQTVNDPIITFNDDALRMLRALRFSIAKEMGLSWSIQQALNDVRLLRKLQESVSIDRVKDELKKMFAYSTVDSLEVLAQYPLLRKTIFAMANERVWLKPTLEER